MRPPSQRQIAKNLQRVLMMQRAIDSRVNDGPEVDIIRFFDLYPEGLISTVPSGFRDSLQKITGGRS